MNDIALDYEVIKFALTKKQRQTMIDLFGMFTPPMHMEKNNVLAAYTMTYYDPPIQTLIFEDGSYLQKELTRQGWEVI